MFCAKERLEELITLKGTVEIDGELISEIGYNFVFEVDLPPGTSQDIISRYQTELTKMGSKLKNEMTIELKVGDKIVSKITGN